MNKEKALNEKILSITEKIRKNHPELLEYLNEMPVTIPDEDNPEISVTILTLYYDSLVSLLDEYEENNDKTGNLKKLKFTNNQN